MLLFGRFIELLIWSLQLKWHSMTKNLSLQGKIQRSIDYSSSTWTLSLSSSLTYKLQVDTCHRVWNDTRQTHHRVGHRRRLLHKHSRWCDVLTFSMESSEREIPSFLESSSLSRLEILFSSFHAWPARLLLAAAACREKSRKFLIIFLLVFLPSLSLPSSRSDENRI